MIMIKISLPTLLIIVGLVIVLFKYIKNKIK